MASRLYRLFQRCLPALFYVYLAGCSSSADTLLLRDWRLPAANVTVELPTMLDRFLEPKPLEYILQRRVVLPAKWAGQPITLSIPYFGGATELVANNQHLGRGDRSSSGYRSTGTHVWTIPAASTSSGLVDLSLVIQHRWTQSSWLRTAPRLSLGAGEASLAYGVERARDAVQWLGIGSLGTIAFVYVVLYFLRPRRSYALFATCIAAPIYYLFFDLGVTQHLTSSLDVFLVMTSLTSAIMLAVAATHAHFNLGPMGKWLWTLFAVALLSATTTTGNFQNVTWSARTVIITLLIGLVYQVVLLARLYRRERNGEVMVHLVGWISLTITTPLDNSWWLGFPEILSGVHPAGLGLAMFAFAQLLGLARALFISLEHGERLNGQLADSVVSLQAGKRETELLNIELQRQIAQRSRHLSDGLAKLALHGRAPTLAADDVVDARYRIVRPIGAGAAGAVYEAVRLSDQRRLAMKVLTQIDFQRAARFAREAQLACELFHPNIVQVVDVELSGSGFMYLVMEYVDGSSLDRSESRYGQRSWGLEILTQLADGLAAIHRAGIVHRDLKPANILLVRHAEKTDIVKIADFGIAGGDWQLASLEASEELPLPAETEDTRALPAGYQAPTNADVSSSLTQTGMIMGTPRYMAPELADGRRNVAPGSDVYAFGLIAYQLLTGSYPFATPPLVIRSQRGTLAEPPLLPAALTSETQQLLSRCLAVDPAGRPSAAELAVGLQNELARPCADAA